MPERCCINDRTSSMATFCMLKAFSQVGVYVNDCSQGLKCLDDEQLAQKLRSAFDLGPLQGNALVSD